MELNTLHVVLTVPDAHNLTVIRSGRYLQNFWQRLSLKGKGVIPDGLEGVGESSEQPLS